MLLSDCFAQTLIATVAAVQNTAPLTVGPLAQTIRQTTKKGSHMSYFIARRSAAATAALFCATGAWADLTAQDIWSDWKAYLEGSGYIVTGTPQTSGNTLTIADFKMSLPLPEGEGDFSITMQGLSLTENSDGTVSVNIPPAMPMDISGTDGTETFSARIEYTQTGHVMIASGDPSNMTYDYKADTAGFTLKSVTANGTPVQPEVARFSMQMGQLAAITKMSVGDMRTYEQTGTIGSLTYDFAFNDPESTDRGSFTGGASDFTIEGEGVFPLEVDPNNVTQMLKDGLSFSGSVTYKNGSSKIDGTGDGDTFSAQTSSASGSFGLTMNANTLAYDVAQDDTTVAVSAPEFPFPISFEMAKAAFKLAMPVGVSDAEQDFAFGITMADFKMADLLWNLFDPAAVLPRDPATVIVDLSGKAKVFVDIFDPRFPDNVQGPPGELNGVTVNSLVVSAAGAELTGDGAFTFDNTDLVTFGGMPRPAGAANLMLKGANGLLDKLMQMGLVGDQEAMGARMMMGMLAVPGAEPDSLTSTIEINAQGHILANGQRLR